MNSYRLSIGGMSCAGCVASVETALNSVEGVEEALVNFAEHTAVVKGDMDLTEVIKAVKLASFDDNVACVKHIQEDIRNELGSPPDDCIRDGFRDICRQCPEQQRDICKSESSNHE